MSHHCALCELGARKPVSRVATTGPAGAGSAAARLSYARAPPAPVPRRAAAPAPRSVAAIDRYASASDSDADSASDVESDFEVESPRLDFEPRAAAAHQSHQSELGCRFCKDAADTYRVRERARERAQVAAAAAAAVDSRRHPASIRPTRSRYPAAVSTRRTRARLAAAAAAPAPTRATKVHRKPLTASVPAPASRYEDAAFEWEGDMGSAKAAASDSSDSGADDILTKLAKLSIQDVPDVGDKTLRQLRKAGIDNVASLLTHTTASLTKYGVRPQHAAKILSQSRRAAFAML
jgi:hypothetical protein